MNRLGIKNALMFLSSLVESRFDVSEVDFYSVSTKVCSAWYYVVMLIQQILQNSRVYWKQSEQF